MIGKDERKNIEKIKNAGAWAWVEGWTEWERLFYGRYDTYAAERLGNLLVGLTQPDYCYDLIEDFPEFEGYASNGGDTPLSPTDTAWPTVPRNGPPHSHERD